MLPDLYKEVRSNDFSRWQYSLWGRTLEQVQTIKSATGHDIISDAKAIKATGEAAEN